jgi:hypothetical protein
MVEDFFTPKLSGDRFRNHTVPTDILPDLAALQELLLELAKAAYMDSHPERTRAPRNFYEDVQIHLAAIEDGSTKLKLVLFFAGLIPAYSPAFQTARAQLTEAVATAARGQEPKLDTKFLAYFDRIGRGLREDESIQFPSGDGYEVLDQSARRVLIQASKVEEYTENATLRVRVPMADYRSEKFEVELQDGQVVGGELSPTIATQLAEAHHAYRDGSNDWLLIKGIVRKERSGKIKAIDSIEHATVIDPLDTAFRLAELAKLDQGWLDGKGNALSADGLKWLSDCFDRRFASQISLPHLYPTPKGGILAEWMFGREDISLKIDLDSKTGEYWKLNLETDEDSEETLNLAEDAGWSRLNDLLSGETTSEEIS